MGLLFGLQNVIRVFNDVVLRVGRWIATVAIALMVAAILVQVFYRYVLSNPLPWPDEAARFCMLWMTGLIAPLGYRTGGFVAIDTLSSLLPPKPTAILTLLLLIIAGAVLWVAVTIGYSELTGFNAKFKTASLYYPSSITFSEWTKVPRWAMMASLFVGVVLLFIVNVELMLRNIITLLGQGDDLPRIDGSGDVEIMAE